METERPTFPAPEGWEDVGWDDPDGDGTRVWWVQALDLHVAVTRGPGALGSDGSRPHWWWVSTSDADGRPHIGRGHEWDECLFDADDVIAYVHEAAARFND